jgi:hypothetical protein
MHTIELISIPAHLPVLSHPSSPWPRAGARAPAARPATTPMPAEGALLAACTRLARRGSGPNAWAPPLHGDALAFLLDAIGDAVNVWGPDGRLIFRNAASARQALDTTPPRGASTQRMRRRGRAFERRCQTMTHDGAAYVLEVVRPAPRWPRHAAERAARHDA